MRSIDLCTARRTLRPAARPALLLPVLLLGAIGCNTTGRPLPDLVHEINGTLQSSATIVPGDKLEIRFPYESDWDHTTEVGPDGKAAFLALDEILVVGSDLQELDRLLTEKYSEILEKSDLTVRVLEAAPRTASIIGQVGEPGSYAVRDHYTFFELLADAQSYERRTADLEATVLIRWIQSEQRFQAWRIDLSQEYWEHPEPLFIQPLDVVFIPNTDVDRANIFVDQWIRRMLPFPYLYTPLAE